MKKCRITSLRYDVAFFAYCDNYIGLYFSNISKIQKKYLSYIIDRVQRA